MDCGRARLHGLDDALLREAATRGRIVGDDSFQLVVTDVGLIYCRPSIAFAIAARWSELTIGTPVGQDPVGLPIVWPHHGHLDFTVSRRLAANVFDFWLSAGTGRSEDEQPVESPVTPFVDLTFDDGDIEEFDDEPTPEPEPVAVSEVDPPPAITADFGMMTDDRMPVESAGADAGTILVDRAVPAVAERDVPAVMPERISAAVTSDQIIVDRDEVSGAAHREEPAVVTSHHGSLPSHPTGPDGPRFTEPRAYDPPPIAADQLMDLESIDPPEPLADPVPERSDRSNGVPSAFADPMLDRPNGAPIRFADPPEIATPPVPARSNGAVARFVDPPVDPTVAPFSTGDHAPPEFSGQLSTAPVDPTTRPGTEDPPAAPASRDPEPAYEFFSEPQTAGMRFPARSDIDPDGDFGAAIDDGVDRDAGADPDAGIDLGRPIRPGSGAAPGFDVDPDAGIDLDTPIIPGRKAGQNTGIELEADPTWPEPQIDPTRSEPWPTFPEPREPSRSDAPFDQAAMPQPTAVPPFDRPDPVEPGPQARYEQQPPPSGDHLHTIADEAGNADWGNLPPPAADGLDATPAVARRTADRPSAAPSDGDPEWAYGLPDPAPPPPTGSERPHRAAPKPAAGADLPAAPTRSTVDAERSGERGTAADGLITWLGSPASWVVAFVMISIAIILLVISIALYRSDGDTSSVDAGRQPAVSSLADIISSTTLLSENVPVASTRTPATPAYRTSAESTINSETIATADASQPRLCNSNYSGCIPDASDVDCPNDGDGPVYATEPVVVMGDDVYLLDTDGDGRGCEPDQPLSNPTG